MSTRRLLNMKRGGSSFDFAPKMSAYWKFATNLLDSSSNSNNGTPTLTGVSYSGGYTQLNNGSILIANHNDLSFNDGTNDIAFHMSFPLIWTNRTGYQYFINKSINTTKAEWGAFSDGSVFQFGLSDPIQDSAIGIGIAMTDILLNELTTIQISYDGSKTKEGLKLYLNGASTGIRQEIGTYTGMSTDTASLRIGNVNAPVSYFFIGKIKEWAIWKDRVMTPEEIQEIHNRAIASISLI